MNLYEKRGEIGAEGYKVVVYKLKVAEVIASSIQESFHHFMDFNTL